MTRLKLIVAACAAAAALGAPATVLADSCANVSRAPAPCGMDCTSGPVIEGNWVWLPSIGVPFPAWGFSPPGTTGSVQFGIPDAHGNYLNIARTSSGPDIEAWLLENSAVCRKGVPNRQGDHGIQSGCGE